jgi:hypothetical protein
MTNGLRLLGIGAGVFCVAGIFAGCFEGGDKADCGAEFGQVAITAQAGTVQSDGSVTIFGTIQFGDVDAGTELAVHAVYVAGQSVTPATNNFNFRSWSISLSKDVLAAYANGTEHATIPVVAYLYGSCIAQLPPSQEPVVTIPAADGGVDGGADAGAADGG